MTGPISGARACVLRMCPHCLGVRKVLDKNKNPTSKEQCDEK